MTAKPGDVVVIRHYTMINIFKSLIMEVGEKSLGIKISKEHSKACFSVGDPIVLAFPDNANIRISGGRVDSYIRGDGILQVRLDIHTVKNDLRRYDRTPVSNYADVRMRDTGKKFQVLIKDISFYGLLIFTKEDMKKGQQMDVDVFLDRDIISFDAEVIRRLQGDVHMEYGLKILHKGPLVYNHIQDYVRKSHDELVNSFYRK